MKYLFYLFTIIVLLGFNLGLFSSLQVGGQIPNLLLLLTIYFSLEKKNYDFFFVAFVSGVFLDFYSAGFFGAFTLAFLIFAFLIHLVVNNFIVLEINWKSLSLLLLGSLLVMNLILWVYGLIVFKLNWVPDYESLKIYMSKFFVSFAYNWLLLYPVYLLFGYLKNFIDNFTVRRRGIVS
jgi:cell shape-determining protein MreD